MDKLIKLDDFAMWVNTRAGGLHKRLLERSRKLKRKEEPGPEREPEFNWMVRTELQELFKLWGDRKDRLIIYDLGANIGHNTLIMDHTARKYFAGDYLIHAIEPDPYNFRFLEKNLRHNQARAQASQAAVSDYTGAGHFHRSTALNLGALLPTGRTDRGTTPIQVHTLADFAETVSRAQPHFIKMDIEGGEVEVLKGAREFFSNCRGPLKLIMEVHPPEYDEKRSLEHELRFLFEHGFRAKYMASEGIARPEQFSAAGLQPFLEFTIPTHSQSRVKSRGLYRQFTNEQLLRLACHKHRQELPGGKTIERIVRSIFIEKL